MRTSVIAAILLFPVTLLGQGTSVGGAQPNPQGSPAPAQPGEGTGGAAPGGAAGGRSSAGVAALAGAKLAAPPVLHLDGHITNLGCGRLLEFDIVVRNGSSTPFGGGATLRLSGAALNRPPHLEGSLHAAVGAIGPHASQSIHFKADPVKLDCVDPQSFVVVVTQGVNSPLPHPQWDRDALELTTTPPTNCSATGGSRRQPHWNPRT